MSNPAAKSTSKKSSHQPLHPPNPSRDIYEEPNNDAESNFDCMEPTLMPYAIHDFSEGSLELESNKAADAREVPKVASKSRLGHLKKNKDGRRSMSESESETIRNKKSTKLVKPPTAKKIKPVPIKPRSNSQAGSLDLPHATYSELDQKASYATLEPHIGDRVEFSDHAEKSYSLLNH